MKSRLQLRLEGVCNQVDRSINRHQKLYWTLTLLCTIGDTLRTMSKRQRALSDRSTGLGKSVDQVSSQRYRNTHGGGWGNTAEGGNWPDHKLGLPDRTLQADIESLRNDVEAYNSDYDLIREYAGHFRDYARRLDLDQQCRTRSEIRIVSLLKLADRREDTWGGCVDRWDGFDLLSGALLHRIGCATLKRFKHLQKEAYPVKRVVGIGRTSINLGESSVEYETKYPTEWSKPQDKLSEGVKYQSYDRSLTYEHKEQVLRRYSFQWQACYGFSRLQYRNVSYLKQVTRRHVACSRLVDRVACTTERPGAATIITGPSELVGAIQCQGADVRIFRAECLVVATSSGRMESSYVYFPERPESELIRNVITQLTWYHRTSIDGELPGYREIAIDAMQDRLTRLEEQIESRNRWNRSLEDQKKGQRKEVAKYARQLLDAGSLSMLDSKRANNCLPGTLEFCRRIGVPLPSSSWTDTRIDARKLLRLWKASDWVRDSLFLSAIRCCVERVKRERRELAEQQVIDQQSVENDRIELLTVS